MSDASDNTLNTIKAPVDAFKTGSTASAISASTAEAAWLPLSSQSQQRTESQCLKPAYQPVL